MPVLVQVCIVIATLALVAAVTFAIRAMIRLEHATSRSAKAADALARTLDEWKCVADEARVVVHSVREGLPRAREMALDFEDLGDRVLNISHTVVDEVESSASMATALIRGLRTSASTFLGRSEPRHSTARFNGEGLR